MPRQLSNETPVALLTSLLGEKRRQRPASDHVPIRKYTCVCVFVVKYSTPIINYIYHLTSPLSRVAATSYTIVEMQLPFLAPAVGSSSVSLLCRRRESGKSRDHPSGGYVMIAPVGNSSYVSQTHKTGHSYDCYSELLPSAIASHQRPT